MNVVKNWETYFHKWERVLFIELALLFASIALIFIAAAIIPIELIPNFRWLLMPLAMLFFGAPIYFGATIAVAILYVHAKTGFWRVPLKQLKAQRQVLATYLNIVY